MSRGPYLAIFMGTCLAALPALAQSDPKLGTWLFNVERSHLINAPPKTYTRTYTLTAQGSIQAVYDVVYLNGTKASMRYTATSDGKDYPFIGSRFGDTVSVIASDPHRFMKTIKKAGVVALIEEGVISADGRTLTVTMRLPGESEGVIEVFDKQ